MTTATVLFGTGVIPSLASVLTNTGIVVTAVSGIIGAVLALRFGPKAVTWALGKIKLGR